jgi:cell division protein FtsW
VKLTPVVLQKRITRLVILFLLMGEVLLFSATGVLGVQRFGSEFHYITRQTLTAIIGVMMMLLISRVRYQIWAKLAAPLLLVQLGLVAATLFSSLRHHALGASRWLDLGFIQFQPSELAKITVTIYLSQLLARSHEREITPKKWAILLAPVALLLLIIFKQPDLGTTVLVTTVALALFFIAGMRPLYFFGLIGSGGGVALFLALHSAYRRRRVLAFLNPWADPSGSGFQTIQSFLSFHSGRLFGVGIGNGNSKLFFLPEVHTDFIFSLVGEELGFVGAFLLLIVFVYFCYLLFKSSLACAEPLGRYLAFGLALSVILQIAVNLGGVVGLLPVKGLPLPFLSWGRSALLVNLAMLGILLNIIRQSAIIQNSPATPEAQQPKQNEAK